MTQTLQTLPYHYHHHSSNNRCLLHLEQHGRAVNPPSYWTTMTICSLSHQLKLEANGKVESDIRARCEGKEGKEGQWKEGKEEQQ
jgi:hypothetical protein